MGKTRRFLVRIHCEYSLQVEAADAEEAMKKAEKIDLSEWAQAWAETEAEEEPE